MKSNEVSAKTLTAWISCGMLGPLALAASRSSWLAVLLTGLLCTLLCGVIHTFSDGHIWEHKLYCGILGLWNLYAVAVVAAQSPICWPGKGSELAVSLVLLLLAAASAWNGAERASRGAAVLLPLCVLVFAVVLACGVGNIRWSRVGVSTAAPSGMPLFLFLLPVAATAIPRQPGAAVYRCMTGLSIFALALSVVATGILSLPIAVTKADAFYEVSKSLSLFGAIQRFEAVTAVAVTLSVYAMLSMLLSGASHMAEQISPGSGRFATIIGTGLSAAIVVGKFYLDSRLLAVLALLIWGIFPVLASLIPSGKKEEKDENNP